MKIFNTLSGQKEEFTPTGDILTMYVCGVTVYDECHIGHAMSYIVFDTIKRYLEFKGYKIKHVQNFTDIDDKIINRAQQVGISAKELSEKYIVEFFKDMDALNINRASVYPKATEEVPEIIKVIQGLIDKGYAYESQSSVYFRVKQFTQYGKLSHQNINDMVSKVTQDTESKESPLDFALWKAAKPGEPSWKSPWGEGRPGWHIECTAMSLKYLGTTIDFHGGGQDLIFPHHENEITQSESYTGESPFVKFWLHNGLLQFSGDKMSKSLGNLISIKNALKKNSSDAIRLFILGSHYRSPLTYAESNIEASEVGIQRLRQALVKNDGDPVKGHLDASPYRQKFIDSMDDDFNTAQAIAVVFDLVREINRSQNEKIGITEAQDLLRELATTLGFTLMEPSKTAIEIEPLAAQMNYWRTELSRLNLQLKDSTNSQQDAEYYVESLISMRSELRRAKQWELADKLRKDLINLGISLEDTPKGTLWKQIG